MHRERSPDSAILQGETRKEPRTASGVLRRFRFFIWVLVTRCVPQIYPAVSLMPYIESIVLDMKIMKL